MSYAIAAFIERIAETLKRRGREIVANGKARLSRILALIVRAHIAISKEDRVVKFIRSIGIGIQKVQSSLEDSLSVLSLLLELLSVIAIIMILVIAGWSS